MRKASALTEISAAVQINASPQRVWAILADLPSYPLWNPLFRQASGQLTAGSTVTLKSVRPGTERVMTVKVKILAAEPAVQLSWISSLPGIITGEHSFTLTPPTAAPGWSRPKATAASWAECPPSPSTAPRPALERLTRPSSNELNMTSKQRRNSSYGVQRSTGADPSRIRRS